MVNPDTGEIRQAQVFVATLALPADIPMSKPVPNSEKVRLAEAHTNAFEHFCVPALLVPDNLCSAVTKSRDRYEPQINDSYQRLAAHYQTAILPSPDRIIFPKIKRKAEMPFCWLNVDHDAVTSSDVLYLPGVKPSIRELMNEMNLRIMKQVGVAEKHYLNHSIVCAQAVTCVSF